MNICLMTPGWLTWEGAKDMMQKMIAENPEITSITIIAQANRLECGFVKKRQQ